MLFYFIKYPSNAFLASQRGILLWFNQILPVLLPFSILSNLLLSGNNDKYRGNQQILRINLWEWFVIVCGLFFGFPIGSKLTSDICKKGYTNQERAGILCAFTNNMSPVFVSNFVCNNILHKPNIVIPFFISLYLAPLCIGCLLLFFCPLNNFNHKNTASRFQLDMQIIDAGIINSFVTLIKLCGYIVMFSITADLFLQIQIIPDTIKAIIIGLTEVTNGIAHLPALAISNHAKIILAVFFLSFGGLCGIAQTNSMISPCGLSIGKYIKNKILYSSVSVVVCIILLFFGFF